MILYLGFLVVMFISNKKNMVMPDTKLDQLHSVYDNGIKAYPRLPLP